MGGFLVDGCGVSDSFYEVKQIQKCNCNNCKSDQFFSLFEVKRRITVFWIKTLSYDKKYAICCSKCKEGYYISDEQKDWVLSNKVYISVENSGLHFITKNIADKNKYDDIISEIIKDE